MLCTTWIRFLFTCAQCAHDRFNSKTGTPFLYSKSIGAFDVRIGFFSIRLAESHWFGLIETAQSISRACPRKSPRARVFTTACPCKSSRARVVTIACPGKSPPARAFTISYPCKSLRARAFTTSASCGDVQRGRARR